ncbi:PA3496 family putative envelope integrity protein [Thiothrix eikelboomii]|uniref:Uncharacterized protein n=1 Tax=Thiothrix eikelboomii TaxID=92487 RepID=A0A1T4XXP5_9GAMM|nr:hypothetical protein [Thiothrix eikelboomii]SKA94317.1 hypothetical protein SAMN02745130_03647 [Thiothrix eikelboomii]
MHDHENEYDLEEAAPHLNTDRDSKKIKPHIIRRNIEDYREKQALQRRLKDIFDEDFLLD